MTKHAYLNYASTTPVNQDVLNTYVDVSQKYFGYITTNKSCNTLYEQSKDVLLKLVNAKNHKVIYTSGATEANNLIIRSYSTNFSSKKHFITTCYEHPSMMSCFEALEELGHTVTYLKVDNLGRVILSDVLAQIKPNTVLISIMHINNEIGVKNDVEAIFKEVKAFDKKIVTMCDNVQGFGKVKNLDLTNIDVMSLSSHKIYGPKACGCLIIKDTIKLDPQITGGSLELGSRGGMQSLPAQISFVKAAKMILTDLEKNMITINNLKQYLLDQLVELDFVVINCKSDIGVVSCKIDSMMLGESLVTYFADYNIEISTKSACSSKTNMPSYVLSNIGLSNDDIAKTIRISISHLTTKDELDYFVSILKTLKK